MNAELNGIITDVFPVETYGNFEKRVLWVKETDVQYPNHYAIELHQNDVNIADKFKPGDIVKCKIDVRGRAYKTKDGKAGIVNTLKCWAISSEETDLPF